MPTPGTYSTLRRIRSPRALATYGSAGETTRRLRCFGDNAIVASRLDGRRVDDELLNPRRAVPSASTKPWSVPIAETGRSIR